MVYTQAGVGLKSFDHDHETGRYRATYDVATVPHSLALAAALSVAMDVDPVDIDPLYESVDTDAIDNLLSHPVRSAEPVTITLFLEHFEVVISSIGTISLDPHAGGGSDGGIAPGVPT